MHNRPWSIWWDFEWVDGKIKWIVIETDHPQYKNIDSIMKFPIEKCRNEDGYIDDWVDNSFKILEDNLMSGRVSIHTLMKSLGKEKTK